MSRCGGGCGPCSRQGRPGFRLAVGQCHRSGGCSPRAVPRSSGGRYHGRVVLADPAARCAAINGWTELPDFASVNWHEEGAAEVAEALLNRGVGVEAGLWNEAAALAWSRSPLRRDCFRVLLELPGGVAGTAVEEQAMRMLTQVRISGAVDVLLHGEDSSAWPMLDLAAAAVWRRGLDWRTHCGCRRERRRQVTRNWSLLGMAGYAPPLHGRFVDFHETDSRGPAVGREPGEPGSQPCRTRSGRQKASRTSRSTHHAGVIRDRIRRRGSFTGIGERTPSRCGPCDR